MCWPYFYVHHIRKEKNVWFTTVPITSTSTGPYIQGYPQRMRLQSWLYEIYILSVSYKYDFLKYKLLSFIAKSLNKPFKNHIRGRIFIVNLKSLYLKSFSLILSWWTRIKSPGCIFTCITISSGDGFGLIKDTLRFPK